MDESGKIMELSSGGFPWKEHIFDLEEQGIVPKNELFFVIFTDTAGMWRIQAIPVCSNSFSSRLVQQKISLEVHTMASDLS